MREIETPEELQLALNDETLSGHVVQQVALAPFAKALRLADVTETLFLGCSVEDSSGTPDLALLQDLTARGALWFPTLGDLPFRPYRNHLYTADELYDGFDPQTPTSYADCLDARIYAWWQQSGADQPSHLRCTLARRIHDLSISDGITDFLLDHPEPPIASHEFLGRRIAIMGGHSLARTEPSFRAIVELSARLSSRNALVISGGGPGAMEAAHLGTWFSTEPTHEGNGEFNRLLAGLSGAPLYSDPLWLSTAFDLLHSLRQSGRRPVRSLAIPTWLYGHEPPNPFATHIAKYFNNSLREEGLVSLATGGIVFAPGSAGTVQEIFQDAAQNHYGVGGRICPMIFLDRHYWTEQLPIWPLLHAIGAGRPWLQRLALVDSVDEALDELEARPSIAVEEKHDVGKLCLAEDDGEPAP